MSKVKFYKGESMSLVFSAYDKAGEPIDISGYEKEVTLFTPFSSRLIKSVTNVSSSAFSANITGDETLGFEQEGDFNIVVKLKKGDEVKIAKSTPFVLLDPDSAGCSDNGRLSVDSGVVKVDMSFESDFANFDVFFGNGINLIEGESIEQYLNDYALTTTDNGDVLRTGDLASEKGTSALKAVTQKLFSDEVAKKIDGYNVSNAQNATFADKQAARNAVPVNLRGKWQTISYLLGDTTSGYSWKDASYTTESGKSIYNSGNIVDNANYDLHTIDLTGATKLKLRTITSSNGNGGAFFDGNGNYISGYTFTGGNHGDTREIPIPQDAVTAKHGYPKDVYAAFLDIPLFSTPQIYASGTDVPVYNFVIEQFIGDDSSQWSESDSWASLTQDNQSISEKDITGDVVAGQSVIPSLGTFIANSIYHRSDFVRVSEGDVLEITACLSYNFATANYNSCIAGYAGDSVDTYVKPILTTQDAGLPNAQHYPIDNFEIVVPRGINYIVGCSAYTGTGERNRNLKIVRKAGKRTPSTIINRNMSNEQNALACRKSFESLENSNETSIAFFSHLSDVHGDIVRMQSFFEYSKHLQVDAAFVTGDIVTQVYGDDFTFYLNALTRADIQAFHVLGNHELEGGTSITDETAHATYFSGIAEKMGMINEGKCYYYRDFADRKIRVIGLNQYQYGGSTRHWRYFKPDQITWLINTLQSTPAGYGVILLMHQPSRDWVKDDNYTKFWTNKRVYNPDTMPITNITGDPVGDIIDAFIGKTTINKSYTQKGQLTTLNVSGDFSTINQGVEFIAHINGHWHIDEIGYLDTTHKQLVLNITCGTSKLEEGLSDLSRRPNTVSQDAINVYGIDRVNGVVKIARIGSNINYMLEKRDFMIIPYR